jgi:hypothetical protein
MRRRLLDETKGRPVQFDEITAKAGYWRSEVVNARLASSFPGQSRGAAALVLSGLAPAPDCDSDADVTACRLMLAALRVSEGDLLKLGMWVEVARADPRDLLAAAEYPLELAGGGQDARDADLAAYLAWISGAGSVP